MMVLLSYQPSDPDEADDDGRVIEEFDSEKEAQARACDLLKSSEGTNFKIESEDGELIKDDAAVVNQCGNLSSPDGGSGGSVSSRGRAPVGRRQIVLTAAIFNQGGKFAIVQARDSVIMSQSQAQEALNLAQRLFEMPVLLKGQSRCCGHQNLVRAFQNVPISRITGWQRFTFTV